MDTATTLRRSSSPGYPTPPLSPDCALADPALAPADDPSRSPSAAHHSPDLAHDFDPLEGYTKHPEHLPPRPRAGQRTMDTAAPPRPAPTQNRSSTSPSTASTKPRQSSRSEQGWDASDERPLSAAGASERRRSSGTGGAGGAAGVGAGRKWTDKDRRKAKLEPPREPELFESDDEWEARHAEEATSTWHHLPLILVALPPLGAIVHGRAENWSDAIILLLICFYLYQLIKVPWELYYASHARVVLPTSTSPGAPPASPSLLSPDPLAPHRSSSVAALRRNELFALFLCCAVPALGAGLLHYAKGLLSDPERYINRMTVGLFVIASGVRPWMRLARLIRRNSLYHQTLVHHPSNEVNVLKKKVEKLEEELAQLQTTLAHKSDLRTLSTAFSAPLTTLQKSVRRFARQEEYLRLSSDERFAALLGQVEALQADAERREAELGEVRRRQEVDDLSIGRLVGSVARTVLLHVHVGAGVGRVRHETEKGWYERGVAWYAFWPVNAPRAALGWGVRKAVEVVGLPAGPSAGGARKAIGAAGGGAGRRGIEGPPVVLRAGQGGKGGEDEWETVVSGQSGRRRW
ncbi:hypothetical protein JCM10207_002703 [Rhodosporidiobolus poonsookiae]